VAENQNGQITACKKSVIKNSVKSLIYIESVFTAVSNENFIIGQYE
jgi:hypothetical protein